MPDNPGLGEQAINKAAEVGLSSQLDEVENLDVNVKTDPLKLVQGKVDEVKIAGQGLVMHKDLRMETLDVHMTSVDINPISAAFGKVELNKPTKASAYVTLTEDDINRAFNSDYVREQLQSQKIHVNGQLRTVVLQNVEFHLLESEKIALKATVFLQETNEKQKVAFSATPKINNNGKTVSLENIEYDDHQEISQELTGILVSQTSKILNLDNFDLEGMSLRIKHLKVEVSKLTLQADANVEKIPTSD